MGQLARQTIMVELRDNPEPFKVTAINPDYMVQEQTCQRVGIRLEPERQPMTYITTLAWAAMVREGHYSGDLPTFRMKDALVVMAVRADGTVAGEGEEPETVDPTGQGAGPG